LSESEFPKKVQVVSEIEWAKVFPENRDKNGPRGAWKDTEGRTSVDLLLEPDQVKILKDAGCQKDFTKHKLEDGRVRVQFTRPWVGKYPSYGGAPQVAHKDGSPWYLTEHGMLGNGTKAITHVQLYEAGGLIGSRLEGLQVLEHVEYESDYQSGIDFPDLSDGETKENPKTKSDEVVDDDIPF